MKLNRDQSKIKLSNSHERISYGYDKTKKWHNELDKSNTNYIYTHISKFSNHGQFDIIYNSHFIRGKDYELINNSDLSHYLSSNSNEENCQNFSKFSDGENQSDEDEEFDQIFKSTRLRYFNPNKIFNRCNKCKGAHLTIVCDKESNIEDEFCFRCLGTDHLMNNCKNFKCFKCNRIGHRINECKGKEEIKCHRCNLLGHFQDDCIKYPLLKENINSVYCLKSLEKNKYHMPDINDLKKIFILEEHNINEEILRNLSKNIYCPNCAGKHQLHRCSKFVKRDLRERKNFRSSYQK